MVLDVSRETMERLERYVQLIEEWAPILNLISRVDLGNIWKRHIEDSLQLQAYVPTGATSFVDIGSGAGFPGIPLAVASGMFGHFIESDSRKAAFLEVVVSQLSLPARVWNSRAEATPVPQQPLCTARAVARLDKLIALCRPLLLPSATALFPRGRSHQAELAEVPASPSRTIRSFPSVTSFDAAIIVVSFSGMDNA